MNARISYYRTSYGGPSATRHSFSDMALVEVLHDGIWKEQPIMIADGTASGKTEHQILDEAIRVFQFIDQLRAERAAQLVAA